MGNLLCQNSARRQRERPQWVRSCPKILHLSRCLQHRRPQTKPAFECFLNPHRNCQLKLPHLIPPCPRQPTFRHQIGLRTRLQLQMCDWTFSLFNSDVGDLPQHVLRLHLDPQRQYHLLQFISLPAAVQHLLLCQSAVPVPLSAILRAHQRLPGCLFPGQLHHLQHRHFLQHLPTKLLPQ